MVRRIIGDTDARVKQSYRMTKSRNCPAGTRGKHKTPRVTSPERQAALAAGRKTYRNGTDCAQGHINPRRISRTGYCLDCNNAYGRSWNAKNPDRRNTYTRRFMGLPEPTRPDPKLCECCGRKPKRALHLDHDHETGKFRGWLCNTCNTGIGGLGDTIAGLLRAMRYLRRAS